MDEKIAADWERLKHHTALRQLQSGELFGGTYPSILEYEMQLAFSLGFLAAKSKM